MKARRLKCAVATPPPARSDRDAEFEAAMPLCVVCETDFGRLEDRVLGPVCWDCFGHGLHAQIVLDAMFAANLAQLQAQSLRYLAGIRRNRRFRKGGRQ